MKLGLAGHRCIVTGASKGIGLAIAESLAAEGADVALLARTQPALEQHAARLAQAHSVRAHAVPADMSDAASVEAAMAAAMAGLGGVDVLVNCAGASKFGTYAEIDDADWNAAFQLKVLGYVRAIRAVEPAMRAQRSGRIINIVGMGGKFATAAYVLGCLNAALLHITKTTADTLAPYGVVAVAVNPGSTATDRIYDHLANLARQAGVEEASYVEKFAAGIPRGRLGTAEEMAAIVTFLCSDHAAYLSGSAIDVDGGAMRGRF
jgi:NAD(P)-dependent dehydrogenase (short-subunit alcohol dehydrogenase family)